MPNKIPTTSSRTSHHLKVCDRPIKYCPVSIVIPSSVTDTAAKVFAEGAAVASKRRIANDPEREEVTKAVLPSHWVVRNEWVLCLTIASQNPEGMTKQ